MRASAQTHAQQNSRLVSPLARRSSASPLRLGGTSDSTEEKLKGRLRQVEAERAQYIAMCSELQRKLQRTRDSEQQAAHETELNNHAVQAEAAVRTSNAALPAQRVGQRTLREPNRGPRKAQCTVCAPVHA